MSDKEPRYTLNAFYEGYDPDGKDKQIEKAAKRGSDGAGYGLGERDMSFSFHTKPAATGAAKRIQAIRGVRVELRDDKADKDIPI
tara:strand:- start:12608 stop:12862 length:255 start_codon:yes stop_codon:yes gene_type:complete